MKLDMLSDITLDMKSDTLSDIKKHIGTSTDWTLECPLICNASSREVFLLSHLQ